MVDFTQAEQQKWWSKWTDIKVKCIYKWRYPYQICCGVISSMNVWSSSMGTAVGGHVLTGRWVGGKSIEMLQDTCH